MGFAAGSISKREKKGKKAVVNTGPSMKSSFTYNERKKGSTVINFNKLNSKIRHKK